MVYSYQLIYHSSTLSSHQMLHFYCDSWLISLTLIFYQLKQFGFSLTFQRKDLTIWVSSHQAMSTFTSLRTLGHASSWYSSTLHLASFASSSSASRGQVREWKHITTRWKVLSSSVYPFVSFLNHTCSSVWLYALAWSTCNGKRVNFQYSTAIYSLLHWVQ